nr:MAG TPA_asm: hypothetical protein [Caudoviricetes sp.]
MVLFYIPIIKQADAKFTKINKMFTIGGNLLIKCSQIAHA